MTNRRPNGAGTIYPAKTAATKAPHGSKPSTADAPAYASTAAPGRNPTRH